MAHKCGKCGAAMELGFVPEARDYSHRVETWVSGEPSLWLGMALRMRGRRKLRIESWRCGKCGFLESYAPDR